MLSHSFWLLISLFILSCTFRNVTSRTATGSTAQQLVAGQTKDDENTNSPASSGASSSLAFWGDLSHAYRIYKQCAQDNISVCLQVKLLTGLQRVLRTAKVLKIIDGVKFVRSNDNDAADGGAVSSVSFTNEKELEAVLPRGTDSKEQVLHSMIAREFSNMLQNFTLQVLNYISSLFFNENSLN